MYTLIRSYVYGSLTNYYYKEEVIDTVPINYLYRIYDDVVIEVSNSVTGDIKHVSIALLKYKFSNSEKSLQQVLDTYTNLPLEGVIIFNPSRKRISYSDALQAGYKVMPCKIGIHPTNRIPSEAATDLLLLRPSYDTDVTLINKYALITVNGYIHRTVTDGEYLYVIDGGISLKRSNHNNLGIISFKEISELEILPITEDMLYKQDETMSFYKKVYINTGIDLSNKTILVSIGGYLYTQNDNSLNIVSDTSFSLNLESSNYLEKLAESSKVLNIDAVLGTEFRKDEIINIPSVTSDTTIKKYLIMSQSFIIIIDTPFLSINKIKIENNNIPNIVTSTTEPLYPMVTGYGKLSEYWKTEEDGVWTANIMDNSTANYNFSYMTEDTVRFVNTTELPRDKIRQNKKHFLEIIKP